MKKITRILLALVSWIPALLGNRKRMFKVVGYPAFASLCFTIGLLWTFPTERVKARIVDEASKRQQLDISIGELGLAFPMGIEAHDVVIADKPDASGKNQLLPMEIKYLEASLSPIAGLSGEIVGDARMEIYGGVIDSHFKIDDQKKRYIVKLNAKGLRFDANPAIKTHLPDLPIKGRIDLDYDLDLDLKDTKRSKGKGEFKMFGVTLGPGKMEVPVPGMSTMNLDLPEVNLGKLISAIEIKDDTVEFTRWDHEKTDIETDATGSVRLRTPLGRSVANVNFRFKISESLLKSNDLFQIALSANKSAEGADGYYYFTMKGSLENPLWQKNRAAELKFRSKGKRRTPTRDKVDKSKSKLPKPKKAKPRKPTARKARKDYGKKDSAATPKRPSPMKHGARDRLTKDLVNGKDEDDQAVEELEEEPEEEDALEEEEDGTVEEDDAAVEEDDAAEEEGDEASADEPVEEDEADKTKEVQGEE